MHNRFIFNENTLKRLPHFFVLIILLLLGLPYIGMNLGFDFSVIADKVQNADAFTSPVVESQIRGYFRQSLLQWTGFSLAAITVLLSFTQYKLNNDKIALIIGLSVLFSGSVEALQTIVVDGLRIDYTQKINLDAIIWVFSNSFSGLILLVGLVFVLLRRNKNALSTRSLTILATFILLTAMALVYYTVVVMQLPNMWYKNELLSRPYELVSIIIYLVLLLFIIPKAYQSYPSILTDCLFYLAITEIVVSVYLMLLSNQPYDSAYNIAYFLQVIAYLIPCSCFVINYVTSYTDVLNSQNKLKIKQNELTFLASHDSLTNLYNRRQFEELLEKAIANSERYNNSIALLLIDMDNFKSINDTFGHNQGDELIKQFSQRLNGIVRRGDVLSRIGGDEFTLILPNIDSPRSARQTAEKILSELNTPYTISDKLVTVSVSIGIALAPIDTTNSQDLFRKADMAMYKAKNTGKNTYQFYTYVLSSLQRHESEIEAHLRQALANNEFELFYQPKFNLNNKEIVGAEVLLHWDNPALGQIPPSEFIPIAERSGLLIDIGHWVLDQACKQIMLWSNKYQRQLSFAINISPVQLANAKFFLNLQQILQEHRYPPEFLELEIIESVLVNESSEISQVLQRISHLGVKLSLDDFGKAYSSLNRLNNLPIDILKIDKSFIANIKNTHEKVVIVDIIIKLAQEMNLIIVAEGIETVEQLNYLLSRKCQYGQGFLLAKPMPAEQFAALAYKQMNS